MRGRGGDGRPKRAGARASVARVGADARAARLADHLPEVFVLVMFVVNVDVLVLDPRVLVEVPMLRAQQHSHAGGHRQQCDDIECTRTFAEIGTAAMAQKATGKCLYDTNPSA
jgi:hypothetical protein